MKNFALRIFHISDANERQNELPLGCITIHATSANGSTNPKNLPYPKGNHPSKFQLAGVRRFGGVREQTNKLTH